MLLQNKVAVVTGSTSGIGLATAKLFARQGAKVVLAARKADVAQGIVAEIQAAGGEAMFVPLEVSSRGDWEALAATVKRTYGALHILVNNAGTNDLAGFPEVDWEVWNKVMEINVSGPAMGIEVCAPLMRDSGGGSIVNIGSIGGMHGTPSAAYTVSKFALRGVSECAAFTYGAWGIRSNLIAPGFIQGTNLTTNSMQLSPEVLKSNPLVANSALGRPGDPEELASAALFLASDLASFTTGVEFPVDGGVHSAGVYGASRAMFAQAAPAPAEEPAAPVEGTLSDENITGTWTALAQTPMGENKITMEFVQTGTALTGTLSAMGNRAELRTGSVENGRFEFMVKLKGMKATGSGVVRDGKLVGKIKVPITTFTFEAERD